MTLTKELKYSVSEVLDVLKHMDEDDINKIPLDIIKYLNENKDTEYVSTIDFTKSLQESTLSHKALSILAYIYKEYLCTPEEKSDFDKILQNNQKEFEKTSNDINLFKNRNIKPENKNAIQNNTLPLNTVNESFFRKLINKIKNFFKM